MASLLSEASVASYGDSTRMQSLLSGFERSFFGAKAAAVVRVPGRVNLIGEHIDYAGYPVLPMALQQDVLVAFALDNGSDGWLRLANAQNEKFGAKSLQLVKSDDEGKNVIQLEDVKSDSVPWYNYFVCGIKGVVEELNLSVRESLLCYVNGIVPPNAGLSSSSAVVVAAAMAAWWAWGRDSHSSLTRLTLAAICARSERFIGTQGGGMDQAIALLGEANKAKLINFEPELGASDVDLPEDAVVVVANSLVEANKANESTSKYNDRVAECRLATLVLAKNRNLDNWTRMRKLGQFQNQANLSLKEAVDYAKEVLEKCVYTIDDLSQILGLSQECIRSTMLPESTKQMEVFNLRSRAIHVFSEADRVNTFAQICKNDHLTAKDKLEQLGQLMLDSHKSCAEEYECSHPKVDEMVVLAKKLGVFGARMTGAGWGGCVVALLDRKTVDEFIQKFRSEFYGNEKNEATKVRAVFKTTPGDGAQIFKV